MVKVAGASGTGLVTAIPLHSQNPQTQSGFGLIQFAQAGCRESDAPQATRSGNLLTRDRARVAAPVSADRGTKDRMLRASGTHRAGNQGTWSTQHGFFSSGVCGEGVKRQLRVRADRAQALRGQIHRIDRQPRGSPRRLTHTPLSAQSHLPAACRLSAAQAQEAISVAGTREGERGTSSPPAPHSSGSRHSA